MDDKNTMSVDSMTCEVCGYKGQDSEDLKKHMDDTHTDEATP